MRRREFVVTAAALAVFPKLSFAQQREFNPVQGEKWRHFELVTRVEVAKPSGATKVWVPVPVVEEHWQRVEGNAWTGNAATTRMVHDPKYGAAMLYADWPAGQTAPVIEVTSRFATRDRAVDLSKAAQVAPLAAADKAFYTAPTEFQPTDGIVAQTARDITRGKRTDMEKAKAIYEWIVDNTERNPKTRGCFSQVSAAVSASRLPALDASYPGSFATLCVKERLRMAARSKVTGESRNARFSRAR